MLWNKENYIQIHSMKSQYPQFSYKELEGGNILFIGELTVRPEFPIYTITIEYRKSLTPLVKILDPSLVEKPPHYYKKEQALCLYHSRQFSWNKNYLISKYIVSWTAAWIYFYEVWLQEGKWYGPEAPHDINKEI
jgi:hypothetical protein